MMSWSSRWDVSVLVRLQRSTPSMRAWSTRLLPAWLPKRVEPGPGLCPLEGRRWQRGAGQRCLLRHCIGGLSLARGLEPVERRSWAAAHVVFLEPLWFAAWQ